MATQSAYHWIFLSVTTNKFLGINEYGKVCIEQECEGHCRFIIHGVSMPSAHVIIRLQNAVNTKFFLQIDGPSPFQIDGFGGNSKQSKKSMFRYTSKVKNNQNVVMLESIRWGYYISCKPSGEIYINQYADQRSSFYRFRIPSNIPLDSYNAMNVLPQFAQNIINQNKMKYSNTQITYTDIKPSAPPLPTHTNTQSMQYQVINPYDIGIKENLEIEGMPSNAMNSTSFTTLNNQFNELNINNNYDNKCTKDDDEKRCNVYDTPNNKQSIFTSMLTNNNIYISPTSNITANGANEPRSRFIIRTISGKDIVIIQNIQTLEYLSMNNIRTIQTSKTYWNQSCHWKVIIKSEMLNGIKIIMLKSCLNQQLLAVNQQGIIISVPSTSMQQKKTQFVLKHINDNHFSYPFTLLFKGRSLTFEEKRFLYDFGFVVIKNAVPSNIYNAAIQFINEGVYRGDHLKRLGPFGPWCCREKTIFDLYYQSHCSSILQSLLGSSIECSISNAQIALQQPSKDKYTKKVLDGTSWHIDGMFPENLTEIGQFSLLIGIVLSDSTQEFMGNITVYPRSHNIIAQSFRQYGVESFVMKQNNYDWNKYSINGKQIVAKRGDIILCHPFLAYKISPNYSNNTHYTVFMRPTKINHAQNVKGMINKNMWNEYIGLNDVIKYYNEMHKRSVSVPCFPTQHSLYEAQQRLPPFNPNVYSSPMHHKRSESSKTNKYSV